MGREYARESVRDCGDYMRVSIYPVQKTATGKRGKRNKPTSDVMARHNQTVSINNLTDHVNLNFSPADCTLHLTYRDGDCPETIDEAIRCSKNAMRCLRRLWAKVTGRPEAEFKYIIVDEVTSRGRPHHHCIISGGLSINQIASKWRYGSTTSEPLRFDETGLCGLSAYICKQRIGYRRWRASKNLEHPEQRQNDYRVKMRDLRHINETPEDIAYIEEMYPGWRVSPYSVRTTGETEQFAPYVSFLLYREDGRKLNKALWIPLWSAKKKKKKRA